MGMQSQSHAPATGNIVVQGGQYRLCVTGQPRRWLWNV